MTDDYDIHSSAALRSEDVDRRQFLRKVGSVGMAFAGADLLAACGGASTSGPAQSPATTTPKRGGTLRIAMIGNGTAETYDPALIGTPIDSLHGYCVFDPLVRVAPGYRTEPGLALTWEHDRNGTHWEIKLREGVHWHDGKPFTADDVIYTFRRMGDPAHLGHIAVEQMDLRGLTKRGDLVVKVPLRSPNLRLFENFLGFNSALVVQDGAKHFAKPVGTGPYKLKSFTPGKRSVLVANRDYWDHPRPYPDDLQILSIDDDTARLNALNSGQIDIASPIVYAQAKAIRSGSTNGVKVNVGAPGNALMFYMRVDKAPFDNESVRQAMRLLVGRKELINTALSGFGAVANDLVGTGLPLYDTSLPQRAQDVEQAKSLLKQAGQSDLRLTLQTSGVSTGFVEAATAFAQQAAAAGVTIKVKREQPASYFNPSLLYLKMPFAQSLWPAPGLSSFYGQALRSTSPFNETHWADPAYDRLFASALAAATPDQQKERWNELQRIQYEKGGYIVWANAKNVDAIGAKVQGLGGKGSGWLYPLDDLRVWNWGLK